MRKSICLLCILCSVTLAKNEVPFAQNVRTTEPLAPAEEQKKLHPPPGFEIQLVAAEPDINKPMNIAFDDRGRLWVTSTIEYPFPAPADRKARDAIKILQDFDENGRARKITTFAENLNIPIGIYPWLGGAIAFDVPQIRHFYDDNNDGHADRIEKLYGTFGQNDTHGITNAFRRGFDGWLYADHGFNNVSIVKAKDGSEIRLNSGNTYRMALDGSHVEQFTWGQTNPFGMSIDPLGNLYTADSHSKPIYQLLRGGYYEGIGKKDDGLGFAPAMMTHLHGSTAIGGSCFYAAEQFPKEFRGNVFVGNVVTSRVNRDTITYRGSTPVAHEEADFVVSEDPWFRPNDITLGPDGAVYVTDFYNRIIGHYEVPLKHPGRDRERGRIWRIVYIGEGAKKPEKTADLTTVSVDQLIEKLGDSNLKVRMLATDEIVDRVGAAAIEPLKKLSGTTWQRVHRLWILHRLGALDETDLAAAANDSDTPVRVHAMRVLSETGKWTPAQRDLALEGLRDNDPLVKRCAADAFGQHPDARNIASLVKLRQRVPDVDTHLMYVVRMSLRNQLRPAGNFAKLPNDLSDADIAAIADVALSIETADAGTFLAQNIARLSGDTRDLTHYVRHAARFASGNIDPLVTLVREQFANDLDMQLDLFQSLLSASPEHGPLHAYPGASQWGHWLVERIFSDSPANGWVSAPLPNTPQASNPWNVEMRTSSDGDRRGLFFSTLPGETLTGTLRSPVFKAPATLKFFVAGHNGAPNAPPTEKNFIRLVGAASDQVIARSATPRNDMAEPVEWDLHAHAGEAVQIEIVDGDDAGAYAWIAVGRFDPPVVSLPHVSPAAVDHRELAAAQIGAALQITKYGDALASLAADAHAFVDVRVAAANALATLAEAKATAALSPILVDPAAPLALREKIAAALGLIDWPGARSALVDAFHLSENRVQMAIALALTEKAAGAEALLEGISVGRAPPRLLLEPKIKERLAAANVSNLDARIKELTKGLPTRNEELEKLIERRRADFATAKSSTTNGKKIFATNCSACHSLAGVGGVVGPQLEGVGARGADRIIEDVLDPNRNVDPAFRYSVITTKDGNIQIGLERHREGENLVFADTTGKEFSVGMGQVKKRVESSNSIMPTNFGDIIPAADFDDLIAYLVSRRPGGARGPATTTSAAKN